MKKIALESYDRTSGVAVSAIRFRLPHYSARASHWFCDYDGLAQLMHVSTAIKFI